MKKDISPPKVENVIVCIVKELNDEKQEVYNVYLVNTGKTALETVLVSSKGYIENRETGEKTVTSTLRHLLNDVEANDFAKIEPIIEDVFGLNNEYLVSYFIDGQMYDKKFIFLAESIKSSNMITVPILNKKGVVIK